MNAEGCLRVGLSVRRLPRCVGWALLGLHDRGEGVGIADGRRRGRPISSFEILAKGFYGHY